MYCFSTARTAVTGPKHFFLLITMYEKLEKQKKWYSDFSVHEINSVEVGKVARKMGETPAGAL